ncbi:MAG: hypothetical protein JXM69_01120 [Anaerolineae bacterium]|nr:hypothetical protein [Anaerolineae bacterium]
MGHAPLVYRNYDLLFTPRLIPQLRNLRGRTWADLIDRLSVLPETHPDVLAFAMMMINLNGCLSCQRDCYRAQRGCAHCARHAIITFKESDRELLGCYETARQLTLTQLPELELKSVA